MIIAIVRFYCPLHVNIFDESKREIKNTGHTYSYLIPNTSIKLLLNELP